MAALKFSELLKATNKVDLEFVDIQPDETSGGLPIVKLILKEALPVVYGRKITDRVTGDSVTLQANDVEYVTINPEALEEIEKLETEGKTVFTWVVEGKSGRLTTNDLKMDVSNSMEAWVVKTSFGAFATNQRRNRQETRTASNVKSIRDKVTKDTFKDAKVDPDGKPLSVATS